MIHYLNIFFGFQFLRHYSPGVSQIDLDMSAANSLKIMAKFEFWGFRNFVFENSFTLGYKAE